MKGVMIAKELGLDGALCVANRGGATVVEQYSSNRLSYKAIVISINIDAHAGF